MLSLVKFLLITFTFVWRYLEAAETCPNFDLEEPDPSVLKKVVVHGIPYWVSQDKKSRDDALRTCKESGLNLVSVLDKIKNEDLKTAIEMGGGKPDTGYVYVYWTSGTRQPNDCWAWWDLIPVLYTNWRKGEPNNTRNQENCIFLHYTGEFNDGPCGKPHYYICEVVTADTISAATSPPNSNANVTATV